MNPRLIVEAHTYSSRPTLTPRLPNIRSAKEANIAGVNDHTADESAGTAGLQPFCGPPCVLHSVRRQCPAAETRQCQTHYRQKKSCESFIVPTPFFYSQVLAP